MNIDEIIEHQGWNDDSVVQLLFQYIENQGSMDALRDFLAQAAKDENAEVEAENKSLIEQVREIIRNRVFSNGNEENYTTSELATLQCFAAPLIDRVRGILRLHLFNKNYKDRFDAEDQEILQAFCEAKSDEEAEKYAFKVRYLLETHLDYDENELRFDREDLVDLWAFINEAGTPFFILPER